MNGRLLDKDTIIEDCYEIELDYKYKYEVENFGVSRDFEHCKYNAINDEGCLNLYNCINKIDSLPAIDENGQTNIPNCYVEEELYLDIQVIFRSDLSGIKFEEAAIMPDLISSNVNDQYCSAAVFTSKTSISLFKNTSTSPSDCLTPSLLNAE